MSNIKNAVKASIVKSDKTFIQLNENEDPIDVKVKVNIEGDDGNS